MDQKLKAALDAMPDHTLDAAASAVNFIVEIGLYIAQETGESLPICEVMLLVQQYANHGADFAAEYGDVAVPSERDLQVIAMYVAASLGR